MQAKLRITAAAALLLLLAPYSASAAEPTTASPAPHLQAAPAAAALNSVDLLNVDAEAADEAGETDLWARIRSGYAINDIDNDLVSKHVNWYATRPDYLARTSARASRYLYHVVTELEKRGMPTELALLPIIESAFNPQANSSAAAVGIWQFMPATGKDYNLKQNAFKDDRRSVLASTDAALSYLQRLYNMFGDWQLALAAYNWGEGNVQKTIRKAQAAGKPTDYESLAHMMPAETRNYVPKLQAVKNIVGHPEQYNVSLPTIENAAYFTAIDKTSDIDVAVAAQLAEMSVADFKALNPQFKRPVIIGGQNTKILLPQENAEKFHSNLASFGKALSSWTTHKIASARTSLASLASKFKTTPEVLREANNIPARTRLKAGSTILVPKLASSNAGDIAENIVENAVMALEPERAAKRKAARGKSKFRAKASVSRKSGKRSRSATNNRKKR
ncbi:transglycosylase SLT domain-containing protein [Pseudoduganella sp. GCM10020061]|uniref:transglycosylase SLT domain-containing protein n=1 Tax=Pseudoduganella sp. GCM10020061 TaxID=3317345 RepID=UPI00363FB93E